MRTTPERISATRQRLEHDANVWLATAGDAVHLVPLSLAWHNGEILVTTPATTATARNASRSPDVRLALDSTVDVVMIDALADVLPLHDTPPAIVEALVNRIGWDPRDDDDPWIVLRCRPRRIQAWNHVGEMTGRTIMRDGVWVV